MALLSESATFVLPEVLNGQRLLSLDSKGKRRCPSVFLRSFLAPSGHDSINEFETKKRISDARLGENLGRLSVEDVC